MKPNRRQFHEFGDLVPTMNRNRHQKMRKITLYCWSNSSHLEFSSGSGGSSGSTGSSGKRVVQGRSAPRFYTRRGPGWRELHKLPQTVGIALLFHCCGCTVLLLFYCCGLLLFIIVVYYCCGLLLLWILLLWSTIVLSLFIVVLLLFVIVVYCVIVAYLLFYCCRLLSA